jgi:ketosteroid isomerase-like protein
MGFRYNPAWRVRLIDEAVDVAASGDLAVYRSTYFQDSAAKDGTPLTQKVNFIVGFVPAANGRWLIKWSVVCNQEKPHPK